MALVVIIGFFKFLASERTGQKTLKDRCDKLEEHVAELERRVDEINDLYQDERRLKHDALQDVTRGVGAAATLLSVVERARPCMHVCSDGTVHECHALDTLVAVTPTIADIITRLKEKHP